MPLTIQQGQYAQGLNSAQAASYASIAAKDHAETSPIGQKMALLVDRLVDLALMDLEAQKAEEPLVPEAHHPSGYAGDESAFDTTEPAEALPVAGDGDTVQ